LDLHEMPIEIERKFLVTGNGWRNGSLGSRYCQGYLSRGNTTVRVRRGDDWACLTIKGKGDGVVRPEFEYRIPVKDADELLATLCRKPLVEKDRYSVKYDGRTWEVDVFHGSNAGLVLAEIELNHPDETFTLPPWVGREVTKDRRYANSSLSFSGELGR
jgi:CYTH domain-containing protein